MVSMGFCVYILSVITDRNDGFLLVKLQLYFSLLYNTLSRTCTPEILTKCSFRGCSETH